MAVVRHVMQEITDDLDGTKAAGTVRFAFEGRSYEIDLSKKNTTAFAKLLAPYVEAGRKIPTRARSGRTTKRPVDLAAVRAWAAEQGIELASRGRIPHTVLDAYAARN